MPASSASSLTQALLAPATATDNKYSRGVVGFATGSSLYPGAALLGLTAAYELGIGMACYLGPKEVSDLVLNFRPETILRLDKADVIVLGSGVSDDESGVQRINMIEASLLRAPLVIDAGGLQIVDMTALSSPAILTPHAGEALKLLARMGSLTTKQDIQQSPAACAQELAELTGQLVLLKGSTTILAMPGSEPVSTGPGSVHLATAGTGDVLAGMIGALAAKFVAKNAPLTPAIFREIALVAVELHSKAADLAANRGEFGASSVAAAISDAARYLRES
jgi:ADP-dependent NAD(P)H-hydrate dehydratase / NAD(P)H-hydrate epimerase